MGQEWRNQVSAVKKGPGVYSHATGEEWGSGERQMEIAITQIIGSVEGSEEKAFRGKKRYTESGSRRYKSGE